MFKSSGRLAFALMTVLFRVRDAIWPPEVVLQELGVVRKYAVLDFGCGPGSYTFAAARLVGPLGRVYAVDINPLAVKRIQDAAQYRGLGNIAAILGDSSSIIPSRRIDLALMHDVLHELDNPTAIIGDIDRVLKPNGFFAVCDHHMNEQAIVDAMTSSGIFGLSHHFRGVYCFTRRTHI